MAKTKKKICVVTSTRADYGYLFWIMKEIQKSSNLELQIVATGSHLSPEFGLTYQQIEADRFKIHEKIEILLSSDTQMGVAKAMGLGVIGFAEAFDRLRPDLLLVLGDRFEILSAASAAMALGIPIAHIAGGDTTEGAIDEAIRHSISKMAHLHFVTNRAAAKRVRQLGEDPKHIYLVGSPSLDYISRMPKWSRNDVQRRLGVRFGKRNVLVTFHPETISEGASGAKCKILLKALSSALSHDDMILFTLPNADFGGREITREIESFVSQRSNSRAYVSLGQDLYLNTLAHVDMVVGNSSSGLYEVPSFKIPTVNIGDRQAGREAAKSVLHCAIDHDSIVAAIRRGLKLNCKRVINPYGDGKSVPRIIKALKGAPSADRLLKKHFFDF